MLISNYFILEWQMHNYESYLCRVKQLTDEKPLFNQVEIEINLGCNRKCSYCFLSTLKRENVVVARRKIMDWDLYTLLLNNLRDIQFSGELNFHFYAEPLLNKKLPLFIQESKKYLEGASTVIYTNGDLLNEKKYNELKKAGLDFIYITRHDNDIPDSLKSIITQPGVKHDSRANMMFNNRAGYLGKPTDLRVQTLPCIYPSLAVIITIDGNVLPCSCDFNESMVFGNIKEQHLYDIWHSKIATEFRSDLLNGNRASHNLCKDCDVYSDNLGILSVAESHRSIDIKVL